MAADSDSRALTTMDGDAPRQKNTHFLFQHKVFTIAKARFVVSHQTDEPVFRVRLGDLDCSLTLNSLRKEFSIEEGSNDAELLDIIAKSLRFVKEIRPGDNIPRELLDGSASWSVSDHHRAIAKARITNQIITWFTGEKTARLDYKMLLAMAEDPDNKRRLQDAFASILEKLGWEANRKQDIVDKVDDLGREMAFIEALRERYAEIQKISDRIDKIAGLARRDRMMMEEIVRVQTLIKNPIREFDGLFEKMDMKTSNILGLLSNEDSVHFIREMRDNLHYKLMHWDEVISAWAKYDDFAMEEGFEGMVMKTYQFLARRYASGKSWRM